MRFLSILLLLVLWCGTLHSASLVAQQLSPAEAAAAYVQQTTGGQILSVRPNPDSANPGWLVKVLLADGRVRTIFVP